MVNKRISHYIPDDLLTAVEAFKLMARESKKVHTSSTRSDIINDAINHYILEATKKFAESYGENELAHKILKLLKNPAQDDLFIWSVIR